MNPLSELGGDEPLSELRCTPNRECHTGQSWPTISIFDSSDDTTCNSVCIGTGSGGLPHQVGGCPADATMPKDHPREFEQASSELTLLTTGVAVQEADTMVSGRRDTDAET